MPELWSLHFGGRGKFLKQSAESSESQPREVVLDHGLPVVRLKVQTMVLDSQQ